MKANDECGTTNDERGESGGRIGTRLESLYVVELHAKASGAAMTDCPVRDQMPLVPALAALAERRRDQIVVTTMGAAREWPRLSQHPLDFHYIPSAMGHAPMLGLGLALAQPQREVIVLNGDGCMLMSLGCLVTIVASTPAT